MHLLYCMSTYLLLGFVLGTEPETMMEPGSCSKRCETLVQTTDPNNATEKELPKFPCSCSSSCTLYQDCCYDAPSRDSGTSIKLSLTMCLLVSDRGKFRAVSKCPKEWEGSSQFCTGSIGFLPPVTSKTSGTTYANLYCAICHADAEDLKTWPVDLRCCPEHDELSGNVARRFIYRRGFLWSRIPNRDKCFCKYEARDNNTGFLDDLEVRSCQRREEISQCSPSWTVAEDEQLCKSYLDPVYYGEQIYRNQHCARCNYKAVENAKCLPAVVSRMLSEGSNTTEILEYCQRHQLSVCQHYLMSFYRGRKYHFSSLLNIRVQSCVPEHGKRCCAGERYDYRSKVCRKLVS